MVIVDCLAYSGISSYGIVVLFSSHVFRKEAFPVRSKIFVDWATWRFSNCFDPEDLFKISAKAVSPAVIKIKAINNPLTPNRLFLFFV